MAAEVKAYCASHESRYSAESDLGELLDPTPLLTAIDSAHEDGDYHQYEQNGESSSE